MNEVSRGRMSAKASGLIAVALLLMGTSLVGQETEEAPEQTRAEPVQAHPEGEKAIAALRSPFCPGLMLEVCPTGAASALRDSINAKAQAGEASADLIEWMIAGHGEEYRALPKAEGRGLLAWLAPPIAILIGLVLAVSFAIRMRRRAPARTRTAENVTPEEEARVKSAMEELERYEESLS